MYTGGWLIQETTLHRYQRKLAARPLLTQSVTTAVLFAVGDITAQQVVEKKGLEKHEFARTGRMFAYGGGKFQSKSIYFYVVPKKNPA